MKKILGLTLGVMSLGLMLVGCDSSSGPTAVSATDLTGKWLINKQTSKGTIAYTPAGQAEIKIAVDTATNYSAADNYFVQFDANGSYTANFPSTGGPLAKRAAKAANETGSWKVSGNTITTISSDDDTTDVTAAISGNSGTFTLAIHESDTDSIGTLVADINATMYATKQ
jgi:hypothetical protein